MAEPTDRRAAERFPVNAGTSCPLVSPVLEDFGPVRIKDISAAGVGLLVPERLEPGMLLAVTLSNPGRSFHKTVMVRVTHVSPAHGLFLVGGTFDVPLRYDEWTALVL